MEYFKGINKITIRRKGILTIQWLLNTTTQSK